MASPAPEDLRIASRIAVFSCLKPETIDRLIAPATIVTLEHGDCLFHQGDPAAAFFIIVDGWVKLYRITMGGDEAIIHILTKGESLAESMALTGADMRPPPRPSVMSASCAFLPTTSCAASVKCPISLLP